MKAKLFAAYAELSMGSKTHFSQWKTYLSKSIDKFLKFEEKFEMRPASRKFPVLFSTVELKLGQNYAQFIPRFKIETSEC